MSTACQKDRPTDRQTDRKTFQLYSYQNKSCSECQQHVRKIERQAERQTDRQTDRFFSLVIKTKLFRMSTGCQKAKDTDRQEERQEDRQNDSMTKMAGQLKSPLLFNLDMKGKVDQNVPRINIKRLSYDSMTNNHL